LLGFAELLGIAQDLLGIADKDLVMFAEKLLKINLKINFYVK